MNNAAADCIPRFQLITLYESLDHVKNPTERWKIRVVLVSIAILCVNRHTSRGLGQNNWPWPQRYHQGWWLQQSSTNLILFKEHEHVFPNTKRFRQEVDRFYQVRLGQSEFLGARPR